MQDPRNLFHVPEDNKIIVYFEWEGAPGKHHVVGSWRSPDGKVALVSDFDLDSPGPKFTGYWTLAIPETIATGLWALDATIDGQPAGSHTFEIASSKPAPAPAPPAPPSPAEIYQRAVAGTVFVTSIDADSETITHGFGFVVGKALVLTAFEVIDGAASLKIDIPGGAHATTSDVIAWNRWQDWALLKVDAVQAQPLERAPSNSWKVGDLAYILDSPAEGSRTIANVNIIGFQDSERRGHRLNLSGWGPGTAKGSPLLDAYGRVIGVLGGGALPGMNSIGRAGDHAFMDPGAFALAPEGETVFPLNLIPESAFSQQPSTLADLSAKGQFIAPLPRDAQVALGALCRNVQKMGDDALFPMDRTTEFSARQDNLNVVLTWGPNKKYKGTQQLKIYDMDNRLVAQTQPSKIELQPRATLYSSWKVPLKAFPPGIYRVDILFLDAPQWRGFFKVVN
jgi:Trypsin-like peptidase domain